MAKRGKTSEKAGEEESGVQATREVHPERTRELRERINASLSALRPQLFVGGGADGRMIEPTLGTIHLQEMLLRTLELCDKYDSAETQEEMIVLPNQLNALHNYLGQLWTAWTQEQREQQARLIRGEKVRTDGTLIIPPNWDQLPKHLRH